MTVGTALLRMLPLAGRLVTGDALYCQETFCLDVLAAGGDDLVTVTANQPPVSAAIIERFASPPPGETFAQARQQGRHGERWARREVAASDALTRDLAWPGAGQVRCVVRTVRRTGKRTPQVRDRSTSLAGAALDGDAARLLRRRWGPWAIEHRLHDGRDVTCGEAASQIRRGAAPQLLAALRTTVIGLLRQAHATNLAAALRELAWSPGAALYLLGIRAQ